jgi:hypothetical protein
MQQNKRVVVEMQQNKRLKMIGMPLCHMRTRESTMRQKVKVKKKKKKGTT